MAGHQSLYSWFISSCINYPVHNLQLSPSRTSPFFFLSQIPVADFLSFDSNFIDLWMHPFTFLFSQKHLIPLLCFCMPAYISHCICCVILQFTYVCIFFQKITNCLRSGAILLHTHSA